MRGTCFERVPAVSSDESARYLFADLRAGGAIDSKIAY